MSRLDRSCITSILWGAFPCACGKVMSPGREVPPRQRLAMALLFDPRPRCIEVRAVRRQGSMRQRRTVAEASHLQKYRRPANNPWRERVAVLLESGWFDRQEERRR